MSFRGTISREPHLTETEWLACIEGNAALVRPKSRMIVNPFTGVHEEFTPPKTQVELLHEGKVVGAIEVSNEFDDDGELLVYAPDGPAGFARSIAAAVAKALNANLEWLDDSA